MLETIAVQFTGVRSAAARSAITVLPKPNRQEVTQGRLPEQSGSQDIQGSRATKLNGAR
jgi:hypothetical protein